MRQGYLVAFPPGAGKTRFVLKKIYTLAGKNWISATNNMLVSGPNEKLKRIWLREICLLVVDKRTIVDATKTIREASERKLIKILKEYEIKLNFRTYQQIKKVRNLKRYPFIVLDEWHRFNIYDHSKNFIEQDGKPHILSKKAKGRYGNHTFFVSATPMNPVLEKEADGQLTVNPKGDDKIITESRVKALYTIVDIIGKQCGDDNIWELPFDRALKKIGIKWIKKNTGWNMPDVDKKELKSGEHGDLRRKELSYLKKASDYESNHITDWKKQEAAWAIGLIRTTYDRKLRTYKLVKNNSGQSKTSFGKKYVRPFIVVGDGNIKDAGKWLLEKHTRVQRLVNGLLENNIIEEDVNRKGRYKLTHKKCLIFCIHQGVARGLQHALSQIIDNPNSKNIACSVHEYNREQEKKFNAEKEPFILIATDKLSESIDLHVSCNIIIHYELPWSPLRLLQRVGRLTRKVGKKYNPVFVYHIMIPGSVEEERVNRLIRRTWLLEKEGAWPREFLKEETGANWREISRRLIGEGPSLQLKEDIES